MLVLVSSLASAACPADLPAALGAARAARAVEGLREVCGCGSADACFELLVHPARTEADRAAAARALGGLCDVAGRPGCGALASGDALADLERDCLAGQAARCAEAAIRAREASPPDPEAAHAWARMGCAGGYTPSCNDLTVLYGDPLGERIVLAGFLEGCAAGRASDCYWAGARLESGFGGVPRDEARGRELLARSCEGGYGTACYGLAGPLLTADPPDVDGWLRGMDRACRGGSPDGCAELATPLADLRAACSELPVYCALADRKAAGRWPEVRGP